MCLATNDPGGPRRCSGDTRATYQKSAAATDALTDQHQQLHTQLAARTVTEHLAAPPSPHRDELLANLIDTDIDALIATRRADIRPDVDAAFAALPAHLTGADRDTTITERAEIPIHRPGGSADTTSATLLDADTAVYRTRRGDYAVALRDGQAYRTLATASTYKTAITMANRIPVLTPLDHPPGGIDDLQQQAYRSHADITLQLATQAAYGRLPTPDEQQAFLAEHLTHARDEIVDAAAAAPLRTELLDATARHHHRQRLAAAETAGQAARLAASLSGDDPEQAYTAAHRHALGTPTRGGARIPHFEHHTLPAPSLGDATHTLLQHSGIRSYGKESARDYTVITRRGGDLTAWGLHDVYGTLRTTPIGDLAKTHARFVNTELTADERDALRTYTSGRHIGSGAYIQINDVFTGRTRTPAPAIANTCKPSAQRLRQVRPPQRLPRTRHRRPRHPRPRRLHRPAGRLPRHRIPRRRESRSGTSRLSHHPHRHGHPIRRRRARLLPDGHPHPRRPAGQGDLRQRRRRRSDHPARHRAALCPRRTRIRTRTPTDGLPGRRGPGGRSRSPGPHDHRKGLLSSHDATSPHHDGPCAAYRRTPPPIESH
nr:hypothetical protein [Mycolicibacterium palauense]